jgi:peptidoglycan hydrolase CwlO-like protein
MNKYLISFLILLGFANLGASGFLYYQGKQRMNQLSIELRGNLYSNDTQSLKNDIDDVKSSIDNMNNEISDLQSSVSNIRSDVEYIKLWMK